MSSTMRPVQVPSSKLAPVEQAEAHALVATFFDALGHFAGELPVMAEVVGVLAAGAQIEELDGDEGEVVRYTRDGWRAQLAASAERRRRGRQGYFLEEVERTISPAALEVRVRSVVEARLTRGDAVERVELLYCAMLVRRVGRRVGIVHLRVERGGAEAS
ncbi:hypothetical protein BH11MYX4_BH11MYX4_04160 [soil metagenome]